MPKKGCLQYTVHVYYDPDNDCIHFMNEKNKTFWKTARKFVNMWEKLAVKDSNVSFKTTDLD